MDDIFGRGLYDRGVTLIVDWSSDVSRKSAVNALRDSAKDSMEDSFKEESPVSKDDVLRAGLWIAHGLINFHNAKVDLKVCFANRQVSEVCTFLLQFIF